MIQRERKTKDELEALCLEKLRPKLGIHGLSKAIVEPYSGPESWTWEIALLEGKFGQIAFEDAISIVRELQQTYDLAE